MTGRERLILQNDMCEFREELAQAPNGGVDRSHLTRLSLLLDRVLEYVDDVEDMAENMRDRVDADERRQVRTGLEREEKTPVAS